MMNKYPQMEEMKKDIREYGLYEVVDDFTIYEENNYRLSVSVILDDDMIGILVDRTEDGKLTQGAYGISKKEFMGYDDNDFKYTVGQILQYGMC